MYWTLELASKLEDAPWPASKDELIDYAQRSGAPLEVIENLQGILKPRENDGAAGQCALAALFSFVRIQFYPPVMSCIIRIPPSLCV